MYYQGFGLISKLNPLYDLNVQIYKVCPRFSSACLQRIQLTAVKDRELASQTYVFH